MILQGASCTIAARAKNEANQQCHFKSSRCCIELLGTDSCRGTVPMELPVPNSSMHHREPKSEIDDTGLTLQGASCTIAARTKFSMIPSMIEIRTCVDQPEHLLIMARSVIILLC